MTSEVIIKNKQCVVLAADSAVTVGNQEKVYNSATKLFSLSKYHPIGVLVYNNAEINKIPIELIIKGFREELKETKYSKLDDYAKNFKSFIKNYITKYLTHEDKKSQLYAKFVEFINFIIPLYYFSRDKDTNFSDFLSTQKEKFNKEILSQGLICISSDKISPYIEDNLQIEEYYKLISQKENLDTPFNEIKELFVLYVSSNSSYTGVAICGYGANDIYPCVSQFKTTGFIGDEFIIYSEDNDECGSCIIPLAQRDMIDTFIRGISPKVLSQFQQLMDKTISKLLTSIQPVLKKDILPEISEKIKADLDKSFSIDDYIDQTHVEQIVSSLDNLSKEELAELAESLVNLQILDHKVSNNLETVGGPIDVAIISKYDGFIWKKRKYYFPAELNFHFFENYFKS